MGMMENVTNAITLDKFRRDVVGYLIPGAMIAIILYYNCYPFITTARKHTDFGPVGNSVICLIIAYVAGRTVFEVVTFFLTIINTRVKPLLRKVFRIKEKKARDISHEDKLLLWSQTFKYFEEHKSQNEEQERNALAIFFSKGMMGCFIVVSLLLKSWIYLVGVIVFYLAYSKANKEYVRLKNSAEEMILRNVYEYNKK